MPSEGPNSPGTAANDASVGTQAWINVDDIKISDNFYTRNGASGNTGLDNEVKIVKADGTIGTENKADTGTTWPTSDEYVSYGGSADIWSESWTAENINDVDFGVVLSVDVGEFPTVKTNYLKATNFGFTIPAGSIIDGILVEIERNREYAAKPDITTMFVDHIRITVTYTEGVAGTMRQIKVSGSFVDKPIKIKVGGTFVDKPIKIKVGGTFQDA